MRNREIHVGFDMDSQTTWLLFPKKETSGITQSLEILVGRKLDKIGATVYETDKLSPLIQSSYKCFPNAKVYNHM